MEADIIIAGRPVGEDPMAESLNEAEQADEMNYEAMSPEGSFSKNALNALVKATNKLLPAFGQTPDYPTFSEDIAKFPTDFVRVLAMFAGASGDAAEMEVIEPEMVVSLDNITDDRSIIQEAGRIDALARNKDFKKFLKEPMPEQEMEEESGAETAMEGEEMSDGQMDELFMERM